MNNLEIRHKNINVMSYPRKRVSSIILILDSCFRRNDLRRRNNVWLIWIVLLSSICLLPGFLCAQEVKNNQENIGEIFGVPVPMNNYYFVKGTLMVFGNYWGPQPQTSQELEDCVWNDLILSYEAFRRNVIVIQDELNDEITKLLKTEKVDFDWTKDKEAYAKKIKVMANEPTELFENQLRHLIQLRKLRQQVTDGISPFVSEEEAHQVFLDEYNTLGIELLQFDNLEAAKGFYNKSIKNAKFWDKEKEKRPNDFKRPGFVALEFLMEMWKLPREAVYKMMGMKIGTIYPPTPVYKGYGVFKILEKRPSEKAKYAESKNYYYDKVKMKKKYQGLNDWIKNLKQQANIKLYGKGEK